jgi:hypothetical protein
VADDEVRMICGSVGDPLINITPGSTRGHYCVICAQELWMSKFMREHWERNPKATPICAPCAIGLEDGAEVQVQGIPGDPYADRAQDIHRAMKRIYGKGHERD